jgi:hypothetical protein
MREVMIVLTAAEVYRPIGQQNDITRQRAIPSKFHFKTSGAQDPKAYSNLGFKAYAANLFLSALLCPLNKLDGIKMSSLVW